MRSVRCIVCLCCLLLALSLSGGEALGFPRRAPGDRRFGIFGFGRRRRTTEEESTSQDILGQVTFDPPSPSAEGSEETPPAAAEVKTEEIKKRSIDEELLPKQTASVAAAEEETKTHSDATAVIQTDVASLLGTPREEVKQGDETEAVETPYWMIPATKTDPGTNVPNATSPEGTLSGITMPMTMAIPVEEEKEERSSVMQDVFSHTSEIAEPVEIQEAPSQDQPLTLHVPEASAIESSDEAVRSERVQAVSEEAVEHSQEALLTGESDPLDTASRQSIIGSFTLTPQPTISDPAPKESSTEASKTEEPLETTPSSTRISLGSLMGTGTVSPSPPPPVEESPEVVFHFTLPPKEIPSPSPAEVAPSPALESAVAPESPVTVESPAPSPEDVSVAPETPPTVEPASVEMSSSPAESPTEQPDVEEESTEAPVLEPPVPPTEPLVTPKTVVPPPEQPKASITVTEAPVARTPPVKEMVPTVDSPESLLDFLAGQGTDLTGVKTGVELPEGKVGILFDKDAKVDLKDVVIGPMEGVDILMKLSGGIVSLKGVTIGAPSSQSTLRTLKATPVVKTGLEVNSGSVLIVEDTVFEGATETMVHVTEGSTFECTRCSFRDNSGTEGGAIRARDSSVKLRSCDLTENRATTGGAIHFEGQTCAINSEAELQLVDSVFNDNRASTSGASVFAQCANALKITGSRFRNGMAAHGGAVHTADVRLVEVIETHYISNKAEASGGALWMDRVETLTVVDSAFRNNSALEADGGAVYLSTCADATVRSSSFVKNDAIKGGAMATDAHYASPSRLFLQSNTFTENQASRSGGAVLLQRQAGPQSESKEVKIETVYVAMANTGFFRNSAGRGGAVFVSSESEKDYNIKIAVRSTNFTHNKAEDVGGGVYCGDHATMVVSYSLFEENEATSGDNCARFCGCQVTMTNGDGAEGNDVDNSWVQDLCPTDGLHVEGSSNGGGAGPLVYVYVAVAAMFGFILMAIVLVAKKRRRISRHLNNPGIQRTLSAVVGIDRSSSILSVSFLPEEGDDDALRKGGPSLMRSQTFGEMDYYVPEGHEDHAKSFDHNIFDGADETAAMAQTLSADDAFIDGLYDEEALQKTGLSSPLPSVPELGSHP